MKTYFEVRVCASAIHERRFFDPTQMREHKQRVAISPAREPADSNGCWMDVALFKVDELAVACEHVFVKRL